MQKIERKKWGEVDKTNMVIKGYVKSNNIIIRRIANELDYQSVGVYIMLLSHRVTFNNSCHPSHKLIAKECNTSVSTVKNIIKILKKHKFINIKTGTLGNTNSYEFPLEKFKENSPKESIF